MNTLLQLINASLAFRPLLFGLLLVLGLVLLMALIWWKRRTPAASDGRNRQQPAQPQWESDDAVFGSLTPGLAAQIPESEAEMRDFSQLLRQAGMYGPADRINIYALRFVLLFVPLVITGILAVIFPGQYTIRILVVGGFLAGVLSIVPRLYVFSRQRQRVREIRHGLADMMDMLSMCAGGGLPISSALDHVAKNLISYPALSEELQILKRQADVGNLRHALADFSKRTRLPEVRQLAGVLIRGDQLGTHLSNSLHEHADHIRETRKQMATMQANKTPVKLTFPLMFCFAPAALILLMSPAFLEIRDFVQGGRDILGTGENVVETIQAIDQNTAFIVGGTAEALETP